MSGLMKLFEEKAKRDVEEKGKPNIAKSESLQTKLELKSTRPLTLPPLFAPFKDEKKGWTKSNVAEQVTLYINLLGYGYGGDKTFVASTKHKDSSKPEWFPDSISYENYTHPSKAKITENEDVIESIFKHHGLDIKTHVVENFLLPSRQFDLPELMTPCQCIWTCFASKRCLCCSQYL